MSMEKPAYSPPADISAEQATLGAMLIEAAASETAAALLNRSDFYREGHTTLFDLILTLRERGAAVDFITVQAELESRNALEQIGGISYLTALLDTVPTAANVAFYAQIVKEKATLRRMAEEGLQIAALAQRDEANACDLIAEAERRFARITEQAGKGIAGQAIQRRKPIADRVIDLADVPPPPLELPYLFGPYLLEGAAHWITGATGLGKSTFGFNVACALAEGAELWEVTTKQRRVLYVDAESGDIGRSLKIMRLYQDRPRLRDQLLFMRDPIRLPDELPQLLEYVKATAVDLVIFDTARRCFSVRDENDNAEAYNRVIPTLDALKQIGVASLTFGHPPKNGGTGARGAGAQEDAGDVNLSLTMHRGEVSDASGIIVLKITKNRLLGMGIPPLFLRRIGDDHFERISADEAGHSSAGEATPTKGTRCAADVLAYVTERDGSPVNFTTIVKAMTAAGHAEGTAKRTVTDLQKEGAIVHNGIGYVLADPFAD